MEKKKLNLENLLNLLVPIGDKAKEQIKSVKRNDAKYFDDIMHSKY